MPRRILIAKPGLDGHDRGAKVIARALRDAGHEVIYSGLHQTPEQIVATAIDEDVAAIGLSSLSGAHLTLFPKVVKLLRAAGADDVVVFGGGIIPEGDVPILEQAGLAAVFINGRALADLTDEKQPGVTVKAGQQLPGFAWLRDDGTTACGNWLYSGSWTEAGPQMQRRGTEDPSGLGIFPGWAWSWPANRRVMYNRASCDPSGKPWDAERRQVWWDEAQARWVGNDVPDFKPDSKPSDHMGPFIMNPEGVGRIFAPLAALADGPFPEHYEPVESPVPNPLHPAQSNNPIAKVYKSDADKLGTPAEGFNIVCTTYRLTEHYHYWTKNNPMNVQLVPEPFVEIPAELADEMGLRGGELVKVSSARGTYVAKAMVTKRIKPMLIDGKKTYQIGIPIHWGYRGIAEEAGKTSLDPANQLSPAAIDPNAYTPEYKGFLVKIEKV